MADPGKDGRDMPDFATIWTESLKILARGAAGAAAWGKGMQQITGCDDAFIAAEIEKRLQQDRDDFTPGRKRRDRPPPVEPQRRRKR